MTALWGPGATRSLDPNRTIDAMYRRGAPVAPVILPTGFETIDLIPASRYAIGQIRAELDHADAA